MFGVSFTELAMVAIVALLVVGPKKLPGMLRTVGDWVARLRRLTTEMRAQTGIDDILREEGIDGVGELRAMLRGENRAARSRDRQDFSEDAALADLSQEYPVEGADAGGALPDDLVALGVGLSPTPPVSGSLPEGALSAGAHSEPRPALPPSV